MNKLLLTASFFLIVLTTNAQIKNVNPNKNEQPWIVGGLRVPSINEINKIPVIKITAKQLNNDLPQSLDNSTKQYFRPVFDQIGGSCAQASGIAYNFTYEINRERGTSANVPANQFPTHYTYNFLNDGDEANGSFYTDGWGIIKADGCPTIETYGGLTHNFDPTYWMSGYSNYKEGMNNRVKDFFSINVNTPEGLEILKHWMFDHLENASDGSIVNFAAGISNEGYNITEDNKIISWGYDVNHAMTFVGWDDNITYDFNNDGAITNDIDINNDGVVDMKDWEKGALIMVNSWGAYWGNQGKAYVMYKLLAEPTENGGIFSNKVFGIHVKESQNLQLIMNVNIAHSLRKLIKISAGISSDTSDTEPEHILNFPLFSKQGGLYPMGGDGVETPIEIAFDVSSLLSYTNSSKEAKFFLKITENDIYSSASGQIYDFSIKDNQNNEYVCSAHNIPINDNTETLMSVVAAVNFEKPEITTASIPNGETEKTFSYQLNVSGGTAPYNWTILQKYTENALTETYPEIDTEQLTPSDNDDGYTEKTISFDFPFYGKTYNKLFVTTDGSIMFESGFSFIRTEDAITTNKTIAVFASDLMIYPDDNDGIFYQGDTTHATFRWKTSLFEDQAINVDVAVTLYSNGEIKFYYGNNISQGLNWASGISNGNGSCFIPNISGVSNPSNNNLKMIPQPFPAGLSISNNGIFQGICPNEVNTWDINFIVTDDNSISTTKKISFSTIQAVSINTNEINKLVCYPNPFNNQTIIGYHINNNTNVNLSIYDISGKQVANLVNAKQKSGNYNVIWEPSVAQGIYFYLLKTDKSTKGGKLVFQ